MVVMKSMTINSWKMMQIRFINIGWLLLTGKLHDNYVMRFDGKPFDFGRKISLKTKESFPSITEESTLATSFFNDEEYRDMALQWVQPNSYSKGTPNMTAKRLRGWVNYPLLTVVVQYHPQVPEQISTCTPIHWLHVPWTSAITSTQGKKLSNITNCIYVSLRSLSPPISILLPCSDEPDQAEDTADKKKLVLLYHDESTFHSNHQFDLRAISCM